MTPSGITIRLRAIRVLKRIVTGSFSLPSYGLGLTLALSCGRDASAPANAIKQIVVPPRDTAAMKRQNKDSAFVVLHAVAALEKVAPRQVYRLLSYQRTDSATVITLIPVCRPPIRCVGGGGRVLVDSLGKATVVERFR